jgi:hypothetical protein
MTARYLFLPLFAAVGFVAVPISAQVPRPSVTTGAAPGFERVQSGVPSFRDPKTGQVWTPENVGVSSNPTLPQDRAFDPNSQVLSSQQVLQQQAQARVIGPVPVTAGPSVPLVEIDNPSLRVIPGARWQVVIYLQNNSGGSLAPTLNCRFTNGGQRVLDSAVSVPPVAGGQRVGLTFVGPPSDIFVDSVSCGVGQP